MDRGGILTPHQTLEYLEQEYGLSSALLQRHLRCDHKEALRMIEAYKIEKALLKETMQLLYDTEDMLDKKR